MNIDLVNFSGIVAFMFTDDFGYEGLSQSVKNYSIQEHVANCKSTNHGTEDYWKKRISKDPIGRIFAKIMDHCWQKGMDFSLVDVGAQYGLFSITLGKYIKAHNHTNKIYAFDCGVAGKLTKHNIKLNLLDDIIEFEYKAVCDASIPQLVYYDNRHTEDNHIVKHKSINLPSYVVDGITLDDLFFNENEWINDTNCSNNNDSKNRYTSNSGLTKIINMSSNDSSNRNLLIKIDTQGAEPLVFRGMQRILSTRYPPLAIIFEFTPLICKRIIDPLDLLNSMPKEYTFFNIEKNGVVHEIVGGDFMAFIVEISSRKHPWTDLLMLHTNARIDTETLTNEISNLPTLT